MMKSLKKLFAILLSFSLIVLTCPIVFAEGGCYNKLSDIIYTFDESASLADYVYAFGVTEANFVELADGEFGKALKLTKGNEKNFGVLFYFNNNAPMASPARIKYSFKNDSSDEAKLYMNFRNGDGEPEILSYRAGKIYLLGKEICTYERGQWYDTELNVNMKENYARMGIKKCDEETWNYYDVFSDSVSAVAKGTQRVEFGFNCTSVGEQFWFDNYSQNNSEDVIPTLNSYGDDFENDGNYRVHKSGSTIDVGSSFFYTGWGYENSESGGNVIAEFSNKQLADYGRVMTITKNEDVSNGPGAFKKPFSSAENSPAVIHDIKFKLGGKKDDGSKRVYVEGWNGGDWFPIVIENNSVVLGEYTDIAKRVNISGEFGGVEDGKLYDCEIIYDAAAKKLISVISNGKGKQFAAEYETNGNPLKTFEFALQGSCKSEMYADDFEWNVINGSFEALDSRIKSEQLSEADLDETAIFTFNRTINPNALSEAEVVINGVQAADDEYSISSMNGKLEVALKKLEKSTSYTVQITGVKDLLGNSADSSEVTFTTASRAVYATTPVLSGKTVTTTVSSYYANGQDVVLIAALYSADGTTLENAVTKKATVAGRTGEKVSLDISALGETTGKKIKAFVWSGFDTMKPYAAPLTE